MSTPKDITVCTRTSSGNFKSWRVERVVAKRLGLVHGQLIDEATFREVIHGNAAHSLLFIEAARRKN